MYRRISRWLAAIAATAAAVIGVSLASVFVPGTPSNYIARLGGSNRALTNPQAILMMHLLASPDWFTACLGGFLAGGIGALAAGRAQRLVRDGVIPALLIGLAVLLALAEYKGLPLAAVIVGVLMSQAGSWLVLALRRRPQVVAGESAVSEIR